MPRTSGGFSQKVSRFFRALHRKHKDDDAFDTDDLLQVLTTDLGNAPKTVMMPSGLARQVRHLVEYVTALDKANQNGSSSQIRRQTAAVSKTFDRIVAMLEEHQATRSMNGRETLLPVAVDQLLTTWECIMQSLDFSRYSTSSSTVPTSIERLSSSGSSSANSDEQHAQLESLGLSLLTLIIQQRPLDFAFMTLGAGECNAHRNDGTRKRSSHEHARPERDDALRVSVRDTRRPSVALSKKSSLPVVTKIDKPNKNGAPMCELARRALELHQSTIRMFADCHDTQENGKPALSPRTSTQTESLFLARLLSTSYLRIPGIRDAILAAFQGQLQSRQVPRRTRRWQRNRRQSRPRGFSRVRSTTLTEEITAALFLWAQNLHPKCHAAVVPYNRSEFWGREASAISSLLRNATFQRVFVSEFITYLISTSTGSIDWKCLPGASTLKRMVLAITQDIFMAQLRALEPSLMDQESGEASALKKSVDDLARQAFNVSAGDDPTVALFLQSVMKMMKSHPPLIKDWMMAVLQNTNAVVPHNVALCLQYLEQLLTRFPEYFRGDVPTHDGSSVDNTTLVRVFGVLLRSEHFQVLKATELFLLKHFAKFSLTLRQDLIGIFANEFKRLFLHWHRDVRFCYFHILLYLTYPGNRMVLCAKSDEMVMGAEAGLLFEMHVRSAAAVSWDVFDEPLCELLTHYNRTTKHRRGLPAAPLSAPMRMSTSSSSSTTRTSLAMRPSKARASLSRPPMSNSLRSSNLMASRSAPHIPSLTATTPTSAATPTPPTPIAPWVLALPFANIERSVNEYRGYVKTYFDYARRISLHDAVPTPTFDMRPLTPPVSTN
ncbi:hypothetical protein Poli38472_010637 [Pythium oligandrum]|uniref:Uncharacterized protein n=1 Tax=Pythium oligandrum TaxID=41045 RepID=A0A8K1FA01_PYTOL|nr:hypothetical protein Poli38472_010637 [Pythium oligandrum]|eukprot:TMW55755.1 hypothetical protein Poli38472_010637 [Pythium oligandrum]